MDLQTLAAPVITVIVLGALRLLSDSLKDKFDEGNRKVIAEFADMKKEQKTQTDQLKALTHEQTQQGREISHIKGHLNIPLDAGRE